MAQAGGTEPEKLPQALAGAMRRAGAIGDGHITA